MYSTVADYRLENAASYGQSAILKVTLIDLRIKKKVRYGILKAVTCALSMKTEDLFFFPNILIQVVTLVTEYVRKETLTIISGTNRFCASFLNEAKHYITANEHGLIIKRETLGPY